MGERYIKWLNHDIPTNRSYKAKLFGIYDKIKNKVEISVIIEYNSTEYKVTLYTHDYEDGHDTLTKKHKNMVEHFILKYTNNLQLLDLCLKKTTNYFYGIILKQLKKSNQIIPGRT